MAKDSYTCLSTTEKGGGDSSKVGGDKDDVMPTGRIVGVTQRNWREYVACFAQNEVSFHTSTIKPL